MHPTDTPQSFQQPGTNYKFLKNAFLAQVIQHGWLIQDTHEFIWRTIPHFKLSRLYKYVIMTNSVQRRNFTVCLNLQAFVHHHHQDRMFISGLRSS